MGDDGTALNIESVDVDRTLRSDDGWVGLEVRWLIDAEKAGSRDTVVGHSVLPPGSQHARHKHPHAEEWEYVISGRGVKRVGDARYEIGPGDLVYSARDVFHSLANEGDETLRTLWGYCGAASLDEAGYVLEEGE